MDTITANAPPPLLLDTRVLTRAFSPKCACKLLRGCAEAGEIVGLVEFAAHGDDSVLTRVTLRGVPPGPRGLHIHEFAAFHDGCLSAGGHYNPTGANHGGRMGENRHRGDLGNVDIRDNGTAASMFVANITLSELEGLACILHEDEDDLGKGDNASSLKTGNAGARLGGGIIEKLLPYVSFTYTHTPTHLCTCAHVHVHVHAHTHTHTPSHTLTHTFTHAHIHTRTHSHIHTFTHSRAHTRTHSKSPVRIVRAPFRAGAYGTVA